MKKKYYYIYKITNSINNKFYIGVHQTYDLRDDYMGSGHILLNAYKKYGTNNFNKEILEYFDNPEDMFSREKEIVTDEFIINPLTYNMTKGGSGSFAHIDSNGYCNVVDKDGVGFKVRTDDPRIKSGELFSASKGRIGITNGIRNRYIKKEDDIPYGWVKGLVKSTNKESFSYLLTLHNDEEYIKELEEKNTNVKVVKGKKDLEKTFMITNGTSNKRLPLYEEIPEGWWKGSTHKKMCINNGFENMSIYKDEEIPEGWKKGRYQTPLVGMINVTNGKDNRKIYKDEEIPEGWKKGFTFRRLITNGIDDIYVSLNDKIPEGWVKKYESPTTNKISIIKDDVCKLINSYEEIPEGWVRGNSKSNKSICGSYYTNGKSTKKFKHASEVPNGWWLGKTIKNSLRYSIKITNGIKTVYQSSQEEIPEGWWKGQHIKLIWINDGIKNTKIPYDDVIPEGFTRGKHKNIKE